MEKRTSSSEMRVGSLEQTLDSAAKIILGSSTSVVADKQPSHAVPPRALWKTREWLSQQFIEHKGALNAAECDHELLSEDIEKIEIRAVDLQNRLIDAETDSSLRTLILQRLQLGDALMKTIYPEEEEQRMHTRSAEQASIKKKVEELLSKQAELGSAVLRIDEEIKELTSVLDEKKAKNLDLLQTNRSLMWDLEQAKLSNKAKQEETNSAAVKTAMWTHEKNLAKVELIRHGLQALVLASGIHWAEDDDLTELLISLGTPVEQLFE